MKPSRHESPECRRCARPAVRRAFHGNHAELIILHQHARTQTHSRKSWFARCLQHSSRRKSRPVSQMAALHPSFELSGNTFGDTLDFLCLSLPLSSSRPKLVCVCVNKQAVLFCFVFLSEQTTYLLSAQAAMGSSAPRWTWAPPSGGVAGPPCEARR